MEASDYLRALRRRVWILILIPLIAGAVAVGVTQSQPKVSGSTALVLAHPNVSSFGSTVGYVTAFQGALTSNAVIDKVHQATGVSASDLAAGLTANPTAANSISFNVTYSGTQQGQVVAQIPALAARGVLDALISPLVATAQSQASIAQAAATKATSDLTKFSTSTGLWVPAQDYQSLSNQLAQLRLTYDQNMALANHPYSPTSLNAAIGATVTELHKLAPQVAEYQALKDTSDRAALALQAAEAQLTGVQQQQAAVTATGGVVAGSVTEASTTSTLVKSAGGAVIVGFLVALGLVVLLERRSMRRKRKAAASAESASQVNARHATTSVPV